MTELLGDSAPISSNLIDKPTLLHAISVLTWATECGPHPDALAAHSGIRIDLIYQIADRMRTAGLWSDDRVDQSEWWDASGELNARALFNQAQVAAGLAHRVVTDAGFEYVLEDGENHADK